MGLSRPASRLRSRRPGRVVFALGVSWLVLVGFGFWCLARYSNTPGETPAPPPRWPSGSALPPPTSRPVLLLFAHPRCPCTRATLEELAGILETHGTRLDTRVLFFRPAGGGWEEGELWRRAAALPVCVAWDEGGGEGNRFGVRTSGHVLLFGSDGRLLFSGGITPSRGHAGPSAGREALLALLDGRAPCRTGAEVFGCPLCTPRSCREESDSCR